VRQRIAEFATLIDRTGHIRRRVAGDTPGERAFSAGAPG
jgi:hypothetical protein